MNRRSLFAAFSAAAVARPPLIGRLSPADTGTYDVTAYGAKGDGVADDRGAIQSAIAAAEKAGGGIIYFPPGTYLCSYAGTHDTGGLGTGARPYSLILGRTGQLTFRGAGRGLSVIKKAIVGGRTSDYNLFATAAVTGFNVSRVSFEDLTLDGGQVAASAPFTAGDEHLLFAARVNHLDIRRCEFRNARGGGVYVWQSAFVRVEDCHFELLDRAGVNNALTLTGSAAGQEPWYGAQVVRDCTFVNNGQMNIGMGGYQGSGGALTDVIVSGCFFLTDTAVAPNGQAIEMVSAPEGPLERATIEDCDVRGGRGLTVQGTDVSIRRCSLSGINSPSPWGQAIAFVNPGHARRVTLEDIQVDGTTDEGILVGGASDLRLSNVTVLNAGKEGIKQTPAAWGQPEALSGAQLIACRAAGCQRDGISIDSSDVHFVECVAHGNGTASPDTHSGLAIGPRCQRTLVIGGRFGADGETQQGYGIDNAGEGTRLMDVVARGRVGPVNLRSPLAMAQPAANAVKALPYGPLVPVDASLGTHFRLTVTDGRAFAIADPANAAAGQQLVFDILNAAGGAMGTVTWGAPRRFILAGPLANPAAGNRRTITFYYDGTDWVETGRAGSDLGG